MAFKLKKQYQNQTIVLANGELIDAQSIDRPSIQNRITKDSSLHYMFDVVEDSVKSEKAPQPEAPKAKRVRTSKS